MRRAFFICLGLVCVLAGAGWGVWSNERILAEGRVVRLELAPVDPRSLMQGDYMVLNYALSGALQRERAREDAYAIVRLDARQVATLLRVEPELPPADKVLADDEVALRFRVRGHRLQVATNAFFFQEGKEPEFRHARYGEFRVGRNGEPRLTALLDGELKRLGDSRY